LDDRQRLDLLESLRRGYRRKSALIGAQLPVAAWYEMIGEATLADTILDRIVHNAHRITLEGDGMRKRKTPTFLTGAEINEINDLLTATRLAELDRARCPQLFEMLVRGLLKSPSRFSSLTRSLRS
jgi:hypothetical protein